MVALYRRFAEEAAGRKMLALFHSAAPPTRLLARRKGADWWVAAMTDWERRTVGVPLGFLGDGAWEATVWADGPNADKVGTDYRRTTSEASASGALRLDLAPGGGAVVRLRRR